MVQKKNDWTNVSFEVGRTTLKHWRDTGDRRSEEAVELWEHVLSRDPAVLGDEQWAVYEQICIAALDVAHLELAHDCISTLDARFPGSRRVLKLKAMTHEATGQYSRAVAIYERLIEEDPTNNSARKRIIAVQLATGQRTAAIQQLNQYLKTFINDSEAWLQLSELFLEENDLVKAAHCLEECVLVWPLNSTYLRRLADIRYTQGGLENLQLAKAYYERALKMNENDLRSQYGLFLTSSQLASLTKTPNEKKKATTSVNDSLKSLIDTYKAAETKNSAAKIVLKTLQDIQSKNSQ